MAREKYGYAETSDLRATVAGPIRSVVNENMALENGMHLKIGDLSTEIISDEVYGVQLPAQGDAIVLVHSSLYAYDTTTTLGQHEMFLRKEAGYPARAYFVYKGDRYGIVDYCITPITKDAAPVVGNLVVVDTATGFLKEIAAETETDAYGFVAMIEKVVYKSNLTLVHLKVVKNETVA